MHYQFRYQRRRSDVPVEVFFADHVSLAITKSDIVLGILRAQMVLLEITVGN